MKSKEYKALKNYIHNDLGIKKENVNELFEEVLKDKALQIVNKVIGEMDKKTLQNFVDRAIMKSIEDVIYKQYHVNDIKKMVAEKLSERLQMRVIQDYEK